MRNAAMNTIVNDTISSLGTRPNASQERKSSNASNASEQADPTAGQKRGNDSLDLSAAGKLLHQSARVQTEKSQSVPETAEQASALVAEILHQFEQTGNAALRAHSAIQGNQTDLLLRPDPA